MTGAASPLVLMPDGLAPLVKPDSNRFAQSVRWHITYRCQRYQWRIKSLRRQIPAGTGSTVDDLASSGTKTDGSGVKFARTRPRPSEIRAARMSCTLWIGSTRCLPACVM